MRVIYCALPLVEGRYTVMTRNKYLKDFEEEGVECILVEGDKYESRLSCGTFLDVISTYCWEFSQIMRLVKMADRGEIGDGDIIFFEDIEFPGNAVSLKYLARYLGRKWKVGGYLHAGSYTIGDFAGRCADFMKYSELEWLKAFDGVFVATNYHKNAILERRVLPYAAEEDKEEMTEKIYVVGNVWDSRWAYGIAGITRDDAVRERNRNYDIVLPNRPDKEKGIAEQFALLMAIKEYVGRNLRVAVTTSRKEYCGYEVWPKYLVEWLKKLGQIDLFEGLDKSSYYNILLSAKVMLTCAWDENFGYCPVEAMTFNCAPLMPNKFSYPELVDGDREYLYDDWDELLWKASRLLGMEDGKDLRGMADKYNDTVKRIIRVMERW